MSTRRSLSALIAAVLAAVLTMPQAVAEPSPAPPETAGESAAPIEIPDPVSREGEVSAPDMTGLLEAPSSGEVLVDAEQTDIGTPIAPPEEQVEELKSLQEESQAEPLATVQESPALPGSTAGTYLLGPDQPRPVSIDLLPYTRRHPVALPGSIPRDATGAPVYIVGDQVFDHPVRLAQDGLDMLESFRLTGNNAYLRQAEIDARRLIDIRVVSRESWFYPYGFDFALHGDRNDVITAPWYSAMAQGQALSLFTRLYAQTNNTAYLEAAQRTFTSLTLGPGTPDQPFVTWVDSHGHLFLEEYAQHPLSRSDQTLNGHLFAIFGLYDYYMQTSDEAVLPLFSGALRLVRDHYRDYRNPGWMSKYCLTHPHVTDPTYHAIHIQQFGHVAAFTGQSIWADFADELFADYPDPVLRTQIRLAAGRFSAFQFARDGSITGTRVDQYSTATRLTIDRRERIRGRGIHYRVSSGPLSGWWIPEQSGRAYAHLMLGVRNYPVLRQTTLPNREIIVRQFDNAGNTTALRRITPAAGTTVNYPLVTVINGETWFRPVDGPAPYFWVRAADTGAASVAGQTASAAPTITGLTVTPSTVRRTSVGQRLSYTVVVDVTDPQDKVRQLDVAIGTNLQGPATATLAGSQTQQSNPSSSGRKRLTAVVEVPYRLPNGTLTPAGPLDVLATVTNSADPTVFAGRAGRVTLDHQAVVTTRTSSSDVRRAQPFTISGTVTSFDGRPVANGEVRISYVPAGWTRGSYAGTARTDAQGRFSLPVRAWYTGSWMAQFMGTPGNPPNFQGVWVRVN